jgi:UDP-N-acetylglucosamine--N-acetylmuramyl-(pentapeptide) pyrophosphoryl-undecaprenol N-acetylglucosamine transferase
MARNAFTLLRGVRATQALIARERPAAILGTGGYVCVPIFIAARLARIPTVIYLPDVVPGLAVRLLARIASAVACSVEDSARYLAKRADGSMIMTGYPVRAELHNLDRAACRAAFGLRDNLPTLLIYGGSRGARSINQATAALLASILPIAQIIHVCGREGDHTFLEAAAAQLPAELRSRYLLYQYLHSSDQEAAVVPSMISAFGAADLTLCRSGASTIGELPAVGLPAVLVPYPYVHQEENADYLVRHGAAQKVLDGEMLGDGRPDDGPLFRQLRHLIVESSERDNMAQRSRALARPEAAHQLAGILLALAAGRRVA